MQKDLRFESVIDLLFTTAHTRPVSRFRQATCGVRAGIAGLVSPYYYSDMVYRNIIGWRFLSSPSIAEL